MATNRREEILAAANRVLNTKGIDELSVRNVAAEAGIGASTLRHYFPSQKELYNEVIGGLLDMQINDGEITNSKIPAAERLTTCMLQLLPPEDAAVPELMNWFGYYQTVLSPGRGAKEIELGKTLSTRARNRVRQWLTTLEDEGHTVTTDKEAATVWLLSTADGLCLQLLMPGTPLTLDGARDIMRLTAEAIVG